VLFARAPDAVPEPGAAASLRCAHAGALTGLVGGGQTLYCLGQGNWTHIPIEPQPPTLAR